MVTIAFRDYKDALRYQSRHFWGRPGHLVQDEDIQLGRVVFHVRKTLSEIHDRKAPAFTDMIRLSDDRHVVAAASL